MDVAYLVPPRDHEQLRYSLRSLANVAQFDPDVDRVWLVGDCPTWARNVEHVPGNRMGSKGPNIFDNWLLLLEKPVSVEFVAMNDDFYITHPVDVQGDEWMEPLHPGLRWPPHRSLLATLDYCRRYTNHPLSFELHRPVVMDAHHFRVALAEVAWDRASNPPQWRSVYGNRWDTGHQRVSDVKVRDFRPIPDDLLAEPYLSTSDASFSRGQAGRYMRQAFPEPSRYET